MFHESFCGTDLMEDAVICCYATKVEYAHFENSEHYLEVMLNDSDDEVKRKMAILCIHTLTN